MEICVVGAGYVGLTTAAVLADMGHTVFCTDVDTDKIAKLRKGIIPIYEPGLAELITDNQQRGTLFFDTDSKKHMAHCPVIMIAVGTPSAKDGSADMKYVKHVITAIAETIHTHKIIIMKSTVPPGTADWVEEELQQHGTRPDLFDIVSNPEFLREGTAIEDTVHPDRIVIGAKRKEPAMKVQEMYASLQTTFLLTNRLEAELIKYASNAFLATKISFINEISRICDAYKADITEVSQGIGLDERIGGRFLQAGLGYGGSCFPKDVNALDFVAASKGVKLDLLQAVKKINRSQIDIYLNKITHALGEGSEKPRIAVWGATFKENTDDIRYSQSIALMKKLTHRGYTVYAYDPLATPELPSVIWCSSPYVAVEQADVLVVATAWSSFLEADWHKVKTLMRQPVIVDGRNVLDKKNLELQGFAYIGVGRP
ncbi:UDP-glucose dehydrogenase family protein [Paenibacillus sp. Leaf72]|uniref:UDP-glucose dehydrogenase family protein n=1 Tax=Paenibacillus sp. Leaf72 TaxID=1736234 RepID=UPI0006F89639|nr:UDP-glucose/GDP-mannose dehydrogenase family protein [Paenibacillus sp. Leaf72]KQO16644.1 UDP-glucose 6-dehydrogenase [Paenibacillus sp. Leaf72]